MRSFKSYISEASQPRTVPYRWSGTDTQHTMNYNRTMPSSVPNAKWYVVDGSYDKKKKDYRLLRDGVVIAHIRYHPSEGVWRWETIYGAPRGGLGLGRHDKGKYVSSKPFALSLAEKEIIEKERVTEDWSKEYKRSINCNNPKGFSQRAHCQGRKKG